MTLDQALVFVADLFELPVATLSPDMLRSDLPAWDSLGQLVLMSALDQQFGIRLTQQELSSLDSVNAILNILRRHGRLTG